MARVTGIGGIFLKARDAEALVAWCAQHLGIELSAGHFGKNFLWTDEVPATTGMTVWSLLPADSSYFGSGLQTAMVNYRVDDLDALSSTNSARPRSPLIPSARTATTAVSPGSPTPKATASSSGSRWYQPPPKAPCLAVVRGYRQLHLL
jgi:hypothetical protein